VQYCTVLSYMFHFNIVDYFFNLKLAIFIVDQRQSDIHCCLLSTCQIGPKQSTEQRVESRGERRTPDAGI